MIVPEITKSYLAGRWCVSAVAGACSKTWSSPTTAYSCRVSSNRSPQVGDLAGVKFEDNTYFSDGDANTLFAIGTRPDREELGFDDWVQKSGETDTRFEKTPFPEPDRCIELYMQSLGSTPTHATFIAEVRKQSKVNWRPELTASVINDWLHTGSGAEKARQ